MIAYPSFPSPIAFRAACAIAFAAVRSISGNVS
jgi:hypothetical protein